MDRSQKSDLHSIILFSIVTKLSVVFFQYFTWQGRLWQTWRKCRAVHTFASLFCMTVKFVLCIKGITQSECIWEQVAEENI
jgi:hypothetical protein